MKIAIRHEIKLLLFFLLLTFFSYGSDVFIWPGSAKGWEVFESVAMILEDQEEFDVVPFDRTLSIYNDWKQEKQIPKLVFENLGVQLFVSGRIYETESRLQWDGVLIRNTGENLKIDLQAMDSGELSEKTAKAIRRFLKLPPVEIKSFCVNHPEANNFYSLGLNYKNRAYLPKAISLFEIALEMEPTHLMAKLRLAQCLTITSETEASQAILNSLDEKSLTLDLIKSATAFRNHRDSNRLEKAEEILDQALASSREVNLRRTAQLLLEKASFSQRYLHSAELAGQQAGQARAIYALLNDKLGQAQAHLLEFNIGLQSGTESETSLELKLWTIENLVRDLGYRQYQAQVQVLKAKFLMRKRPLFEREIRENLTRAEQTLREIDSRFSLLNIQAEKADLMSASGRFQDSEALLEQIVKEAQELLLFRSEIYLRSKLATVQLKSGRTVEAVLTLENVLFRLRHKTFPSWKKHTLNRLVPAYLQLGQLEKAHQASSRLMEEAKTGSDEEFLALSLNNHGEILLLMGQLQAALGYFEDSLAIKAGLNKPYITLWTVRNLAQVQLLLGNTEKAKALIEICQKEDSGNPLNLILEALYQSGSGRVDEGLNMLEAFKIRSPSRWGEALEDLYSLFLEAKGEKKPAKTTLFLINYL